MKNYKSESGITMVSLVITIIVLLILSAITLGLVLGDNGIITKANTAKEETMKAQAKEEIERKILEYRTINNGEFDIDKFFFDDNNLLKDFIKNSEEHSLTSNGYKFYIDRNGNISDEEIVLPEPDDISTDNTGRVVSGSITLDTHRQTLTITDIEEQPDIVCVFRSDISTYPSEENPATNNRTTGMFVYTSGRMYRYSSDTTFIDAIGANFYMQSGDKGNRVKDQIFANGRVNSQGNISLSTFSNGTVWEKGTYNYYLIYFE